MYARSVDKQRLTFAVSGMLWQRSLVMIDSETKSLWSHLLGRAMRGPLKDTKLKALPSVMTDWNTWRGQHPETTVLAMPRTSDRYVREFLDDTRQFVIGMAQGDQARAWPFDQLVKTPVVNDQFTTSDVLVAFDTTTKTAYAYHRRIDQTTSLEFGLVDGQLVDRQTKSVWNLSTGRCVRGTMEGVRLKPVFGIVSYRDAWADFHPASEFWQSTAK